MSSTDYQPKLIYLARRPPGLDRAGFISRWRQHGALGMSMPRWRNIARYLHCDVDPATASHDGVGMIWHRSVEARRAHIADRSSRGAMESDEQATFAEPIVQCCLLTREEILLAPPPPADAACKLIRVIDDRADGRYAEALPGLAAAGLQPLGLVNNLPLPPDQVEAWGIRCRQVEEWWFGSRGSALQALQWLADRYPRSGTCLLTNEIELYRG